MTELEEAIEECVKTMPKGFSVRINIEQGSSHVELVNNNTIESISNSRTSLPDQLYEALSSANCDFQHDKLSACVNCNQLPTIIETAGRYEYRLDHTDPSCPGRFRLTTQQHTEQQCIDSWNTFNVR